MTVRLDLSSLDAACCSLEKPGTGHRAGDLPVPGRLPNHSVTAAQCHNPKCLENGICVFKNLLLFLAFLLPSSQQCFLWTEKEYKPNRHAVPSGLVELCGEARGRGDLWGKSLAADCVVKRCCFVPASV